MTKSLIEYCITTEIIKPDGKKIKSEQFFKSSETNLTLVVKDYINSKKKVRKWLGF